MSTSLSRSEVLLATATAMAGSYESHQVVATALSTLGAQGLAATSIGLRTSGDVLRTFRSGLPDDVSTRLAALSGNALPGRAVMQDGEERFLDAAGFAAEFPLTAEVLVGSGFESAAVLPLSVQGARVGYIAFHLPTGTQFDDEDRLFLRLLATFVAGALERARLVEREREAREEAAGTGRRFSQLQELMTKLAVVTSEQDVADVLAADAANAMDAQMATVAVLTPDGSLRLAASVNQSEQVKSELARFSTDANLPATVALRTRQAVLLRSSEDRERDFPELVSFHLDYEATATLPLLAAGRALGTLTFGWAEPRAFNENELKLFAAIAEQSAAALDRGRLFDAERAALASAEDAEQRLRLLAYVGSAVSSFLDPDAVTAELVRLLVPSFAAHCIVFVQDDDRLLQPRAVANHHLSSLTRALSDLRPTHPSSPLPHVEVFRTGVGTRIAQLTESDTAPTPRGQQLLGASMLAVPMTSRGERLGVIVALREAGTPFSDTDLILLETIGARTALALDNAQLFTQRTRVAAQLQADLLPTELPRVAGLGFAARYRVGDRTAEVGGDFYDVFALGDDEYAMVIGDVTGRGVAAAGLTGLARATFRALSPDLSPAQALKRLNDLLIQRGEGSNFLTAAYVRLKLSAEGVHVTTALGGHPHPLLARASSGEVERLGRPGLILGVKHDPELHEETTLLGPGDVLLLFTDGVTEAKSGTDLFGEHRLAQALLRLRDRSPETVVDGIEDVVLGFRVRGEDDLALLTLRVDADGELADRVLVDQRLPAEVSSPTVARRLVRRGVDGLLEGRPLQDLELSVNELVTNAVRHLQNDPARTPRTDPIRLRALLAPGRLRIEVSNPGPGFLVSSELPDADAEGGRGLPLVSALSRQMGVETKDGITLVWFDTPV